MRPKIVVYIATSIDGYIARKNGDLTWLDCVNGPPEDYGFQAFKESLDAIILGRNTYETCSEFDEWPYKNIRTVVLSNTLQKVRKEAELYQGELSSLCSRLHEDGVKKVWVDGGITISNFLAERLVDEITLSIIPILLGSGIPLFNPAVNEHTCKLTSSQSYPSGLTQLRYELLSADIKKRRML